MTLVTLTLACVSNMAPFHSFAFLNTNQTTDSCSDSDASRCDHNEDDDDDDDDDDVFFFFLSVEPLIADLRTRLQQSFAAFFMRQDQIHPFL